MRKGFTLVELSIVLVIIGLLIGGILIGQSLIDSARINKLITEMTQYERVIKNFKNTYRAYPGDMKNFGSWSGNGDGYLASSGNPARTTAGAENYLAWKHLSDARYLPETYNGYSAKSWTGQPVKDSWGGGVDAFEEGDAPQSKAYEDSYIFLRDWRLDAINGTVRRDHSLSLVLNPAIAIEDVISIETKIDDMKPYRGIIGGYNSSGSQCQSGNLSYTQDNLDLAEWDSRTYDFLGTSCEVYWRIDSLTERVSG